MVDRDFWTDKQSVLNVIYGTGRRELFETIETSHPQEESMVWCAISGIPRPDSLIDYYRQLEKRGGVKGLGWLNERFANVVYLQEEMWEKVYQDNPVLFADLMSSTVRESHSEGKYENRNVPGRYFHEIVQTATPMGWAGPRVLLLLVEDKEGRVVKSIEDTFPLLDEAILESKTKEDFLAILSKKVFERGIAAEKIIDLVLKNHIREEQNNTEMYFAVIDALKAQAPKFFGEVESLYAQQPKEDNKAPGWVKILNEYNNAQR